MYKIYEEKRDSRGLTNYQVAKALEMSESTFSLWKKGERKPNVESLIKLSKFFDCPIEDFVKER